MSEPAEESTVGADRLKYLTKGELREEIAYTVGADPTRYGVDSDLCLKKSDVFRIATQLQPEDDNIDLRRCDLRMLYKLVCKWAGCEYQSTAGRQWCINRDNLKMIHRAVGGRPPREVFRV